MSRAVVAHHDATPEDRRAATPDLSLMLWTAIGGGGIWVAVLLLRMPPDLVSGAEQDHLPVAAFTTWFWGGVGTVVFLWVMGRLRGSARWQPTRIGTPPTAHRPLQVCPRP